jgi:tetratricopeptide (TPR) repeat protein
MRKAWLHIARLALPVVTLAAFYAMLFWFSVERARVSHQPRPALTAEQSKALLARSKSLIAEGNYREALQPSLLLFAAYEENHIYIEQVAEIYEHLGDYQHAAQYWEKYLDHAPRPETGCPQIGDDYWKQGEAGEPKAIAAYERCLKLDPTNPDAIFYLAHALEKSGELDRAASVYQQGIKTSPQYVDLRLGLARVWVQQGKYPEAQQATQQVLAKSPNNVDALLVMGLSYMRQHNLKEAKKYLTKGVKLSDTYTDFHLALAHIAEVEKDDREAMRQYTRILELQPDNGAVRARLESLKKETRP